MRIMGLDLGEKRIGVALSDPMGWTAQAHSVLQRGNNSCRVIADLCAEYDVEGIVLGWPLNMNGTAGPKAAEAEDFARQLTECTGLKVELQDERLTTKTAERVLLQADVSRKKRRQVIDKMAAAYILQVYLDSHKDHKGMI
ncbi:Holliday junction resolvase RuvX [Syntrophomonas palmitatica]|uniref:Holliday junction resolvase RuvX n=1 Tax=Syntrophomonas palmitatica TaxID=402877 RepID=UPI0006CF2F4A|nr:Holliday junction resolvase RuvX [Syntrophomonas palmitatica]